MLYIFFHQFSVCVWRHVDDCHIVGTEDTADLFGGFFHVEHRFLLINVGVEPAEAFPGADGHLKGHVI